MQPQQSPGSSNWDYIYNKWYMKTYGFFSIADSSKEIIAICKVNTVMDAIKHFAKIKNLSAEEFVKLYIVTNEV